MAVSEISHVIEVRPESRPRLRVIAASLLLLALVLQAVVALALPREREALPSVRDAARASAPSNPVDPHC